MVASVIFTTIFVAALVAIQIFALRVYTLGATKLTATQGCRKTLDLIRDDVRQGKYIYVGNVTDNSYDTFTAIPGTNGVAGNALQIFQTTNQAAGAPCSIYYLQTNYNGAQSSNNVMLYTVTTTATNLLKLTTYITNSTVFTAEDCWGKTVSNDIPNNVVYTVTLQYYQWEYPIGYIGGTGFNAYDYYQLRTKVCRRTTD
jgi:hypothetical protein